MNFVEIAGHLGSEVDTRFTPSGQKVSSFRVATNVRRAGKEETIWWKVTIWGDRFDKLLPHLKKGSAVIVLGELSKPEIYNDREGQPQVSLNITAEIIRFSPFGKGDRQGAEGGESASQSNPYNQVGNAQAGFAGYGFNPAQPAPGVFEANYHASSEEQLPF